MTILIAVIFACTADQCAFLRSDTKFFDAKECAAVVEQSVAAIKQQAPLAYGVCLQVDTRDLT